MSSKRKQVFFWPRIEVYSQVPFHSLGEEIEQEDSDPERNIETNNESTHVNNHLEQRKANKNIHLIAFIVWYLIQEEKKTKFDHKYDII